MHKKGKYDIMDLDFKALIDTYTYRGGLDLEMEHHAVDELDGRAKEGQRKHKVNLHREHGEGTLNTLTKHKKANEDLLDICNITCKGDITLERVDVAIDTNSLIFSNSNDYRLLRLLFRLVTARDKNRKMAIQDEESLKCTSLYKPGTRLEIAFYDKATESQYRHPYYTRLEFRYKKEDKSYDDFNYFIDKTIDRIKGIDNHLESIENIAINTLKRVMDEERIPDSRGRTRYKDFSTFVRDYDYMIATPGILKALHQHSGLKGTYSQWLKDYRKKGPFKLYKKSDIKAIQKALIKALKDYKK